jgi:hypothetical protein
MTSQFLNPTVWTDYGAELSRRATDIVTHL